MASLPGTPLALLGLHQVAHLAAYRPCGFLDAACIIAQLASCAAGYTVYDPSALVLCGPPGPRITRLSAKGKCESYSVEGPDWFLFTRYLPASGIDGAG